MILSSCCCPPAKMNPTLASEWTYPSFFFIMKDKFLFNLPIIFFLLFALYIFNFYPPLTYLKSTAKHDINNGDSASAFVPIMAQEITNHHQTNSTTNQLQTGKLSFHIHISYYIYIYIYICHLFIFSYSYTMLVFCREGKLWLVQGEMGCGRRGTFI